MCIRTVAMKTKTITVEYLNVRLNERQVKQFRRTKNSSNYAEWKKGQREREREKCAGIGLVPEIKARSYFESVSFKKWQY